jgi:pectin methylesterase-like acyl-CoA thioesterase
MLQGVFCHGARYRIRAMRHRRSFTLGLLALISSLSIGVGQVRPVGLVDQFPKNRATNVSPDTHLVLTFSEVPTVGQSGEIRLYDQQDGALVDRLDLSIPAGPAGRPARGAAAGTAPPPYQKAVIGGFTEGFHFYPIIVHDRTATITLHPGVLKYGRAYRVEIDPGVLSGPRDWTFHTRSAPPSQNATRIVVAADGSGDFNTVQGAVDFIPNAPRQRMTIFIRHGRYEEIVYFRNKHDITFLGEDRNTVVIGYANNENFNGPPAGVGTNELPTTFPYRRASFMADASTGIHVVNLTLRNFTPQGGSQAEALLMKGGRNIVSHVNVYSFQDTVQFNDSVYIVDSLIEGETDFLWGRGPAFFERSTLRELSNSPYMWVRSTSASHGFVFVGCRFETPGSTGAGPFLARNTAQYPDSEIVLIDAMLGRINPAAWSMSDNPGRMRYWEAGSIDIETGRPTDSSSRHSASKQLDRERDASVIAQYRDPAFVFGGWRPEMIPIIMASPKSTTAAVGSSVTLSATVAAIPDAAFEWRRDGKVVVEGARITGARTSELTITQLTRADAGRYMVSATNTTGRAESAAAVVIVR